MSETLTAEDLAQRAIDCNVVDDRQLQTVWGKLGSRQVEIEDFKQLLVREGLLTNYQLDRLLAGNKDGYFYGDYRVLYSVGAGTFARVYRAAHRETNKLYAVKVLRKRFSNPRENAENPATIDSFRREGELGASLKHSNIVPVHEVFSQGLVHYIVMDFVEGRNLREFWKASRNFDPAEATRILADVAAGLAYAHQKGVTHRDLKMSNVLLSSEGRAQLVDFGLATLDSTANDDPMESFSNQRTIDYAGLERATNVRKDDIRSDIFFTGCIYYQLLSGKPPMSETRDRLQRLSKGRYQDIKPIRDVAPEVPPLLSVIVGKATEFDPEKRYQTPVELLTDLRTALKRLESAGDGESLEAIEKTVLEGHDKEGKPRPIMVIESDPKLQDVLRKLFKSKGYRVLVISNLARALGRFEEDPKAAELVLVSSGTIGRPALELFNHFAQHPITKTIPAVLVLGKHQAEWQQDGTNDDLRKIEIMPLKARELRKTVLDLLKV